MKKQWLILVMLVSIGLAGCEVSMSPSRYWGKILGTETDSDYYEKMARKMVKRISKIAKEYDIRKIAVLDFVDEEGRVPVLGEFMAEKVVQEVARKKFFRVAQKGEVEQVLANLNLKPSSLYTQEEARMIGKSLNSQGLIKGKLTDIGTDIDIHISLVDIVSGEVIASATEGLNRSRFAVEMLRQHNVRGVPSVSPAAVFSGT